MRCRTWSVAAAGLALALTTAIAVAKVEQDPSRPPPAPNRGASLQPVHTAPLRAQCWQKGVKVVDEKNLRGLSITAATRRDTVTFKRADDEGASVFLLPLGESLCLLQPER
jgi:hypothetical protein